MKEKKRRGGEEKNRRGGRGGGAFYLSGEWDEMVLAEAGDVDVADENHLIVIFGKDGIVDYI
jgi:hypothetical protein